MISKISNVLSEARAAEVVGLSHKTLQRLRLDGGGPAFVKLTERRVGYTESDLATWLQQRTVASTSAATVRRGAK